MNIFKFFVYMFLHYSTINYQINECSGYLYCFVYVLLRCVTIYS